MVSREVIESLMCFGNLSFHFAAIPIPMSVPSFHPHYFLFPKFSCITCIPSSTLICPLGSQNSPLCCLFSFLSQWCSQLPTLGPNLLKTVTLITKPTVIYIEILETCIKTDLCWVSYPQSISFRYDTDNLIRTDSPNHNSQNNTLTSQWRSPW